MTTNKKHRRRKTIEAIIIIADIENSSFFAERTTADEYNRMIREYHRIASKAIDEYSRASTDLKEGILHKRAFGDEILILLNSRNMSAQVTYALNLAVLLEVEWSRSQFNSRRIRENKPPCRLRVGIGYGEVTLAESVWEQGPTPEGYAIARAKRIESCAGGSINAPHILVTSRLSAHLENIKGIETGKCEAVPANDAKGISALEAVRIKSYEGLYNEFKRRIRMGDRYTKWFTRGYQAHSAGDYREAYRCTKLAVKIRPDSTRALNNLGTALLSLGRNEEAEQVLRNVVKADPEYPRAYYNLGNLLSKLQKNEEAAGAYKKAIKLKPDYHQALSNFACVRLGQGLIDEALVLARKALTLNPDNEVEIKLVDLLKKLKNGKSLVDQGKLREAEKVYRKVLRANPESPMNYNNLGDILLKQGKLEEAEEAFKRALELNPSSISTLCNYAVMRKEQGRIDEALELARKALYIIPRPEEVTTQLVKELEELQTKQVPQQ